MYSCYIEGNVQNSQNLQLNNVSYMAVSCDTFELYDVLQQKYIEGHIL